MVLSIQFVPGPWEVGAFPTSHQDHEIPGKACSVLSIKKLFLYQDGLKKLVQKGELKPIGTQTSIILKRLHLLQPHNNCSNTYRDKPVIHAQPSNYVTPIH